MGNRHPNTATVSAAENSSVKKTTPTASEERNTSTAENTTTSRSSFSPSKPLSTNNFVYQKDTSALEYWEPVKLIGEGSISSVHLVQKRTARIEGEKRLARKNGTGKIDPRKPVYALKSIRKDHVKNADSLKEMRNEIHTVSKLSHPNIIQVFEAYERDGNVHLIMEYCSGSDLIDVELNDLSESQVRDIVKKILSGVAYLHEHKIVHRDLKLENIMFSDDDDAQVKIIDFGLATDDYQNMNDRVGTLYAMAPQVLQGVYYDDKCDIWSIGVIAYILLCGEPPFDLEDGDYSGSHYGAMPMMKGGVWDDVSIEAKMFVRSMLEIDPSKRPSASKALESAWMLKDDHC